jgi:hypothetical protein
MSCLDVLYTVFPTGYPSSAVQGMKRAYAEKVTSASTQFTAMTDGDYWFTYVRTTTDTLDAMDAKALKETLTRLSTYAELRCRHLQLDADDNDDLLLTWTQRQFDHAEARIDALREAKRQRGRPRWRPHWTD